MCIRDSCKFDVFRASGNGGQCVNTTDSAVRLTHIPTGIVISCQDEKSQLKNKDKALKVLRSRLYEMELAKQHDAEAEARRSQIGTGDRSEKIRTYNFPQGRVTEHRIKLTLYKIDNIMNGDLDEIHIVYTRMINAMTAETEEQKLLPMKKTTFLPEDMPALVGTGLYQEDMVFWPSTHSVMANIVPNYINGIVYGCLVEAYCSEHNARMQAMQNATDSATDMLNELNITYNRVRQADITQELTEIIGGANAQKRK